MGKLKDYQKQAIFETLRVLVLFGLVAWTSDAMVARLLEQCH